MYVEDMDFIILQCGNWFKYATLSRVLDELRKINFNIQEDRTRGLSLLNSMKRTAPFSRNQRFEYGLFIMEDPTSWARAFNQIRLSLSYKPREKDQTAKFSKIMENQNDTIVSYYAALNNCLKYLSEHVSLYSRDVFEEAYEWFEEEPRVNVNHPPIGIFVPSSLTPLPSKIPKPSNVSTTYISKDKDKHDSDDDLFHQQTSSS